MITGNATCETNPYLSRCGKPPKMPHCDKKCMQGLGINSVNLTNESNMEHGLNPFESKLFPGGFVELYPKHYEDLLHHGLQQSPALAHILAAFSNPIILALVFGGIAIYLLRNRL